MRLLLEPRATHRATGLMRKAERRRLKGALTALGEVDVSGNAREYLRRGVEFHRVIRQASGNRRLADHVQSLRDLQMIRNMSTVERTQPLAEVVAEHQRVYDLIIKGDAAGAAEAMHQHIAVTYERLLEQETRKSAAIMNPPPAPADTRLMT